MLAVRPESMLAYSEFLCLDMTLEFDYNSAIHIFYLI